MPTQEQYVAAQRFLDIHASHPAVRDNAPGELNESIRAAYNEAVKTIKAFVTFKPTS